MRPYGGGAGRGTGGMTFTGQLGRSAPSASPSASVSPFASHMRAKRGEHSDKDVSGLPALVREGATMTTPASQGNWSSTVPSDRMTSLGPTSSTGGGGQRRRQASADDASPSAGSSMPPLKPVTYTISDVTTRKELLGIVGQLQSALNERTDSVNLIQRNFTRLSTMYRRDQQTLEELSAELAALRREREEQDASSAPLAEQVMRWREQAEALEKDVLSLREALEETSHRAAVAETTHAAELALAAESAQTLREALEDAHRALAASAETSSAATAALQSREAIWQASALSHKHAAVAMARRLGLFLQHISVALGESPSPLLARLEMETEEEAVPPDNLLDEVLNQVQEPLLNSIRGWRRQCVVADSQQTQASATLTRASRQLERYIADAEREDRERLCEAEASLRDQMYTAVFELGAWWDHRLGHQRDAHATETAALEAQLAARRDADTASAERHSRAQAEAASDLIAQLSAATARANDADDLVAGLRAQLVESQTRIQALLSENKRTHAAVKEAQQTAAANLESERATWHQQHRAALADLESQLKCERVRQAAASREEASAKSLALALETQRAECERLLQISAEVLRVEAQRTATQHAMQYMTLSAESDERHHLLAEESAAREDLQYTIHHANTQARRLHGLQQAQTWHYAASAHVLAETQSRHAVLQEEMTMFVHIARELWRTSLSQAHARTNTLVQHVAALEEAMRADQQGQAQSARALRELTSRADAAEADAAHLSTLNKTLSTEKDQLVSQLHVQTAALRSVEDRTATQQQVAVAALRRLQAAEEASESAYSCPICFQLFRTPITCVPCGHTYCELCLKNHPRNRQTIGVGGGGGVVEFMCPECGFCNVDCVIQTRALDQLAHTFLYRQQVLKEILQTLDTERRHSGTLGGAASAPSHQP